MGDKNFKVIRKSLHNVCKDILPTVMTMEMVTEIQKQLSKQLSESLTNLTKQISARLDAMEEKQKTINDSFIRNVLAPASQVPAGTDTSVVETPAQ